MAHFEIIKLITDICLAFSIAFLCYRILVNGNISGKTSQLLILEASLKGLIKDAEGAGRSLNDELQRRQNSLERVLSDLEGVEKKTSALQQSFDSNKGLIDSQINQARDLLQQLSQSLSAAKTLSTRRKDAIEAANQTLSETIQEDIPEPPSFEMAVVKEDQRHRLPPRKQKDRLTSRIEREVSAGIEKAVPESVIKTTEQVQSAASDVRKISEQVNEMTPEQNRTESKVEEESDTRLGVLGTMKRQVQTL